MPDIVDLEEEDRRCGQREQQHHHVGVSKAPRIAEATEEALRSLETSREVEDEDGDEPVLEVQLPESDGADQAEKIEEERENGFEDEAEETNVPLNLSTNSEPNHQEKEKAISPTQDVSLKEDGEYDASSSTLCYHELASTLPPISLVESAADQARLARLKESLTGLLDTLLGEERLVEMGFPDKDILLLLR